MEEHVEPYQHSEDARLQKAILAGLHDDPKTDVSRMQVEVKEGNVLLKGLADTEEEKEHAGLIAAAVPGVKKVENHLHIEVGMVHAITSFVSRIVSGDEKAKDKEADKDKDQAEGSGAV